MTPVLSPFSFFLLSYTGRVVGNGLQAQRHNPEIKVRGVDPVLVEAKERLEQFTQVKADVILEGLCLIWAKSIPRLIPVPQNTKTKPDVLVSGFMT